MMAVPQKTLIRSWQMANHGSQFVCLKSSEKFEKRREYALLFIMTIRALTHRLKSAPYWLAKTSNWWVVRRTALTWLLSNSAHQEKKGALYNFRHQRILLECSKPSFGGASIEVEKHTQMMVVHQNILSNVMLKNGKLFFGNVGLSIFQGKGRYFEITLKNLIFA